MSAQAVETFGDRVAERAGPLVVKEVLQGLRAKVFAVSFGLLLTACAIVALVAAVDGRASWSDTTGREYLAIYLVGLSLVSFFVIPYTAFRSMSREREDETWVLLILTGLPARSIVRGKVTSALAQALLYGSACAPFVVFSYFLNGVDLLTVVAALVMSAGWCTFWTSVAVAIGGEAETRLGRAGTHLGMLVALLGATAAGAAFGVLLADEGYRMVHKDEFWVAFAAFMAITLSSAHTVIQGAASTLGLATARGGRGARGAITAQVVLGVLFTALAAWLTDARTDAATAGSVVVSGVMLVYGYLALSQPDGARPAQRGRTWLSTPGASRGFALLVLLLLFSTVCFAALFPFLRDHRNERHLTALFGAPMYVLLYLSVGTWLARVTPLHRLGEVKATRLVTPLIIIAGSVLPAVASYAVTGRANDPVFNALNPIVGWVNMMDRGNASYEAPSFWILVIATAITAGMAWAALSRLDARVSKP